MTVVANKNLRLNKAISDSPYSLFNNLLQMFSNWRDPSYVQIESTTKCNNKCMFCIRSPHENFDISMDLYESIIDQLHYSRLGTNHVDLTGLGEPLLNPNIVTMIKLIKRKGLRAGFTTNFGPMNRSIAEGLIKNGTDYLYISIDGATKETFEKIRIGSSFERTMSSIRSFVNIRNELGMNNPRLRMNVVVDSHNFGEIPDLIKLAEDLGLDSISFNRPSGKCYQDIDIPSLSYWETLPESKIQVSRMAILLKRPQPCVALKGCYITYDGYVLPCNSLSQIIPRKKLAPYVMGDIKHRSLTEIWRSKQYRGYRTLLSLGMHQSYCSYCPRPYQM
jgi:radical SAM protein with 4Fe4S-binding SPASM domain